MLKESDEYAEEEGRKFDNGKPRWSLLPMQEVEDIVKVLTTGAKKYSDGNWMHVRPTSRYIDALYRHLSAWLDGEANDQEDGHSHLAHATCNLLFLMWFDNNNKKEKQ